MPADEALANIEQLFNDADASTALVLSQMASIQVAHKKLRSEFEGLKSKNAKLLQKVKKLQSENRALHIVREKLTAERAADREVIRMWQSRMNERAPPSELSTQENPVQPPAVASTQIPSSPPVSEAIRTDSEDHQYPLSQRVLPMSIGLSEPREIETEAEEPQAEELQPEQPRAEESQAEEPPTEMPIPVSDGGSENDRKRTFSRREADKSEIIEKLMTREWHPADFKFNPRYEYVESRSKQERSNMHGSDCAECNRFYQLSKMDVNTKAAASRHRHVLDQQDTPPGYWSMDFHGSSQLSQDKAAEKQYLHMTGQERFEEAIAGGRYVFKDDSINKQLGLDE